MRSNLVSVFSVCYWDKQYWGKLASESFQKSLRLGSNPFDILAVFMKEFHEKFEKMSKHQKVMKKNPSMQIV